MSESLLLKWQKYDGGSGNKISVSGECGLYILAFRRDGFPFYVGTAAKGSLSIRLSKDERDFPEGTRAFLRKRFFDELGDRPWPAGLAAAGKARDDTPQGYAGLVYVPDAHPRSVAIAEGGEFWRRLEIYFVELPGVSKNEILAAERTLQEGIQDLWMKAFGLAEQDFTVGSGQSYFLGRCEGRGALPLKHDFSALEKPPAPLLEILQSI